ncbi:S1 family peptidase [Melioribacter sp. OK-6-Me]|uniref:S1 family peptidase n=1 Tax=unclassified Melioribacter TaxID=2627329 RepID=UPI003ED8E19E
MRYSSAIFLLLSACTAVYDSVYPTLNDGKYDSEFPYKSSSEQLEDISNSINLLNSIAFYTGYVFDIDSKLTKKEISLIDLESAAKEKVYFNRTASGTATLIYTHDGNILYLTVAHIVAFPDTVYSYFINPDGSISEYIESISIKSSQSNYIPDLPDGGALDIILMDKNIDVALLGKKIDPKVAIALKPFNYSWGSSSELEWGTFVYVFGYPMNYKMITKALVSNPKREKNIFLIDAVFNKGSSGGIVLAIRDGVPNFELVGVVRSVPADFQLNLHPFTKEHEIDFNPQIPYKGEVYVEKEQVIRSGIVKVIGIEVIKEFITKHLPYLRSKGYYLSGFLTNK